MVVVPKSDYRLRKIVLITEGAQARGAEQKILARGPGPERQPAGGENPNKMPTGKKQNVSRNCPDTLNHTVRALAYLRWRFASGTTVPKKLPIWASRKDFG
jgi:hypothetical protein